MYATDALPPEEATTEVYSDEAVGAAASEAEGNQDSDEHQCEYSLGGVAEQLHFAVH